MGKAGKIKKNIAAGMLYMPGLTVEQVEYLRALVAADVGVLNHSPDTKLRRVAVDIRAKLYSLPVDRVKRERKAAQEQRRQRNDDTYVAGTVDGQPVRVPLNAYPDTRAKVVTVDQGGHVDFVEGDPQY